MKKEFNEKRVSLNGLQLTVSFVTKIFEDMKLVETKVNSSKEFALRRVSAKELAEYRRKKVPSFVLKTKDGLFHTEIPRELSLISSNLLGKHQCGVCNKLSDADCLKVREHSTGIERYPWIPFGYETFATKCDCFFVAECYNW